MTDKPTPLIDQLNEAFPQRNIAEELYAKARQKADSHLEDALNDGAKLSVGKPHPEDHGGYIIQTRNGPRWIIPNQASQVNYWKAMASYYFKLHGDSLPILLNAITPTYPKDLQPELEKQFEGIKENALNLYRLIPIPVRYLGETIERLPLVKINYHLNELRRLLK